MAKASFPGDSLFLFPGPISTDMLFILRRKLKLLLQRGRQVCRPAGSGQHITRSLDQLKFCCRFSPHTLHLEKKVEVFPAEGGEVLQVQREVKFCRFSPHTLHLEKKVEVFPAGLEAGSAHIHFILKRKLKFFLQRGRQVCRPAGSGEHITRSLDQLKFWCRFSPHTLHLEKKVEVFPAEASPGLQTSGFRAAHHQIT